MPPLVERASDVQQTIVGWGILMLALLVCLYAYLTRER